MLKVYNVLNTELEIYMNTIHIKKIMAEGISF